MFIIIFEFLIMKVILLKEVVNLGLAGEIKEVSDGYARNYLIPGRLADILTKHSLAMAEALKFKRERLQLKEKKDKISLAEKLDGQVFSISAKADDKGTLYSKVDAKFISRELAKQNHNISSQEIKLVQPIKKTGEYQVELNLAGEKVNIKLVISNKT